MSCKRTDNHTSHSSDLTSRDSKDTLLNAYFVNQIKHLTDTIDQMGQKVEFIKQNIEQMTTKQLKEQFQYFPDLHIVSSKLTEIFLTQQRQKGTSTFIYEIPTQIQITQEITTPSLYQIPVQLIPLQTQNQIYEVPADMELMLGQNEVAQYLAEFQTFERLPSKIRDVIQQFDWRQKQFYQIPIEMELQSVEKLQQQSQAKIDLINHIEDFQIQGSSSEQDWDHVDNTLGRMKKMIKDFSLHNNQSEQFADSSSQEAIDELNLTGNVQQDLKLINQSRVSQLQGQNKFYEIPIEMEPLQMQDYKEYRSIEVQCDEEGKTTLFEIPVGMEAYLPQCSINSNLIDVRIQPFKKNLHLSASIESFCYDFKGDEEQKKNRHVTPISNVPELDFCDSCDIASKMHTNQMDSFANSLVSPVAKESLQFKESCIRNKDEAFGKTGVNSVVETLNFKTNNPIFVIASESSSEGSNTDRQMYLSQMNEKGNLRLDIHEKSPESNEMAEYYDMKQKIFTLEEEKNQLVDQLKFSQRQIETLKQQVIVQKQLLKNESKEEINQEKINRDSVSKLEDGIKKKSQQIKKLQQEVISSNKEIVELKLDVEDRNYQIEKMDENFQQIEQQFFTEIQKLNNELKQKDKQIQQMEREVEESSRFHKNQIAQFIKVNEELRASVDDLTKEVDDKKITIEELKLNHDALMTQMEEAFDEKNSITNMKALYSKQYEKMKQTYDYDMMKKDQQIKDFTFQIQKLQKDLKQKIQYNQYAHKAIEEHQKVIDDLREQLQSQQNQVQNSKLTIVSHVEAELDYLRRQLLFQTKQVQIRELKIKQLTLELQKKPHEVSSMSIDFDDNAKEMDDQSTYISDLKDIISDYEKILIDNQQTIKQLHGYVYEYLGDAMEKQQQSQNLYQNLLHFESDLNEVMLQKIGMQKQNKKLKRMIAASERKISAIGNRLIYAAKDKLEDDSYVKEKGNQMKVKNMKSQNSTIKMGIQSNMIH